MAWKLQGRSNRMPIIFHKPFSLTTRIVRAYDCFEIQFRIALRKLLLNLVVIWWAFKTQCDMCVSWARSLWLLLYSTNYFPVSHYKPFWCFGWRRKLPLPFLTRWTRDLLPISPSLLTRALIFLLFIHIIYHTLGHLSSTFFTFFAGRREIVRAWGVEPHPSGIVSLSLLVMDVSQSSSFPARALTCVWIHVFKWGLPQPPS